MSDDASEQSDNPLDSLSDEFTAAAKEFVYDTMGQSVHGSIRYFSQGFLKKYKSPGYCKIGKGKAAKIALQKEDVDAIRKHTFEYLLEDIRIYSNRDKDLEQQANTILEILGDEGKEKLFNEVLSWQGGEYFEFPELEA